MCLARPPISRELLNRIGKPGAGKQIAPPALGEITAAVVFTPDDILLHIALNGVDTPVLNELHRLLRLGAVAHYIAGADDVADRNLMLVGNVFERFQRL